MKPVSPKIFWQTFIGLSALLSLLAIYQTAQQILNLDIILWRSKWILPLGLFALNAIAGAFILYRKIYLASDDMNITVRPNKPLGFILVALGFASVWIVKLYVFGDALPQIAPILWVFLWASLLQAIGVTLIGNYQLTIDNYQLPITLLAIILAQGLIYQLYGRIIVASDYPFSIGYSEASRHYYASMFFAKSLYGLQLPYPFLHPTRYMLMALPFLFNGLPLWFHRLWQSILWIGLTATSSILLARRMKLNGWTTLFVAAWAFLYFLQGAVYYHLQVCVILILAGVSTKKLGLSFLFVILASFWAGMSRVNWFPVPAMLAIAIYLLESPSSPTLPPKGEGSPNPPLPAGEGLGVRARYWLTPFAWGVCGLVVAFAGQFFYIHISGAADVRSFESSFTSALLWNRLLPNDISPSGVIIGITIASAPLIIFIAQAWRGVHPLRGLALLAMTLALFGGGLVVSAKIGGGGDLHNMDAFLVLLALIATTLFAGRVSAENGQNLTGQISWSVIAVAALVPISFALPQIGASFYRYDSVSVQKDIQKLQQVASGDKKVLFVTERQLFTFGELKNISLIPEYEQIELMEMAMSGNRDYLERFYADLNNRRFDLIVAEDQSFTLQKTGAFKEENNAWVRYVGAPLLCAYKPIASLTSNNLQIFAPRPNRSNCKNPFNLTPSTLNLQP